MRNALIIHGHFYQPPRENPWTGLVPSQPSATPYDNWNARITRECYAANAASRILDANGDILEIHNNYQWISFNFGPTLLSWLRLHAPHAYSRIIEADRASIRANEGHGNALAQAHTHLILTLATPEDVRTQIRWGLEDFRYHFGRPAEGMWLPETAVNEAVADQLIDEGMRFIVLSPWQAEAYAPLGSEEWTALDENPLPSDRVYQLERPGGKLAVFFYNHALAQGISFEHFLKNADELYDRIHQYRSPARPDHLIVVATDGEVYGHHEPFGDMCLAALIRRVQREKDFRLMSFGRYLAEHSPECRVRLKAGEQGLGTAWSCFHGVGRWHRDCGCSTGGQKGWNQKWRTPLREALDHLRNRVMALFQERMPRLASADPLELRDRYIRVMDGQESPEAFCRTWMDRASPEDPAARGEFLALLEGQKCVQYMFTSCGFFFSDLAGIETIQILEYAVRACEWYAAFAPGRRGLFEPFLSELELARSNQIEQGSGREIVENHVLPSRQEGRFGAALFILAGFLEEDLAPAEQGLFHLESFHGEKNAEMFHGWVEVSILPTRESCRYLFELKGDGRLRLALAEEGKGGKRAPLAAFPIRLLPARLKKKAAARLVEGFFARRSSWPESALEELLDLLDGLAEIDEAASLKVKKLGAFLLERRLERILIEAGTQAAKAVEPLLEILPRAQGLELLADPGAMEASLSQLLNLLLKGSELEAMVGLLELCHRCGLKLDLTRIQNAVYNRLGEELSFFRENAPVRIEGERLNCFRILMKLAGLMKINTESFREGFLEVLLPAKA